MSWRAPMAELAAERAETGSAVEAALRRVLESGRFVLGPETAAFEAEVATRVGTRFAVGVGSGTEALVLALRALGQARFARNLGDDEIRSRLRAAATELGLPRDAQRFTIRRRGRPRENVISTTWPDTVVLLLYRLPVTYRPEVKAPL